jgi:hypothetical protein
MWGGTDEAESIRTIYAAIDQGINLIDTAPAYGFGRSEEIVGQALADGGRRKRVLIATKVGLDWSDGSPVWNASRRASSRKSTIPCAASAPMSSISIRCIGPTRWCRSRRLRQPWRSCCAREGPCGYASAMAGLAAIAIIFSSEPSAVSLFRALGGGWSEEGMSGA